jgi:uncharacterized protein
LDRSAALGYKERMRRPTHPDPHHPTVPDSRDDPRGAIDLSPGENADLCAGCVKCCTYITVQIDAPRAAWEYDQWIWALHHRGVSLYLERPEKWFVHFETVCEHLSDAGRCAIHGRHPVLCREYDPRSCERRLPLADVVAWFDSGAALERWIEVRRPGHYRRLLAYRSEMPSGPARADAEADRRSGLVTIGEPAGATGPGSTRAIHRARVRGGASPTRRRA